MKRRWVDQYNFYGNDGYQDVQQDIVETFVDRGQLRKTDSTHGLPNGKRILGRKLDHPRQLAVMHSLVGFCYLAAGALLLRAELYPQVLQALCLSAADYKLHCLRHDIWMDDQPTNH